MTQFEIIPVTAENVAEKGFFCKMSARGKPGYEQKLAWLKQRFAEGLQLRLLDGGERGFVEFIPGAHAWRAIENAEDYLVIHCLWVVGRSKGKGYSTLLLDEVHNHARKHGFKGVAAVTSSGNWLIDAKILEHHGYEKIASAPPSFDLMVQKFDGTAGDPCFCGDWEEKTRARSNGLVIYRSGQCPYLDDSVNAARDCAAAAGIAFDEIVLNSAAEVRRLSPTPYGVFAMILNGKLLSYHYLGARQLAAAIEKRSA